VIALAFLVIVVQASGTWPASILSSRSPVTVLSRSETSSTGGRRLRVLVRIDAHAAIKELRIEDLIDNVREIWRPYAEIDFADTGSEAAVPYDDELRLAIDDHPRPPGSGATTVLGWIAFLDGRPQNTITVSVAAARTLMSRGTWLGRFIDTLPAALQQRFVTRALSRSSAHEIGHYLLRSSTHAARGLMREQMTVEEILDDTPALYRLLPSEIAWLDQRLAGALAEAPPSDPRHVIVPLLDRKS
jgi:hypothetical protein